MDVLVSRVRTLERVTSQLRPEGPSRVNQGEVGVRNSHSMEQYMQRLRGEKKHDRISSQETDSQ